MATIPDDVQIRLCRAAFNRALAAADLAAIGPLLAAQAVLVTGTDSAVIVGRKGQLLAWKREFSALADRRNLYVRTPAQITVSAVEPIALEQGSWTCTICGQPTAAGSYAAKWRKVGGAWVIEAEIFVTLS